MHRPQWPASGVAPQRSPEPGGTDTTAAICSPAAAGRLETPAGDGRGNRLSEHSAVGMGVLPGGTRRYSYQSIHGHGRVLVHTNG